VTKQRITSLVYKGKGNVKVKFTLEQATKAQRSRGIALLFNLGARWRWVVNATSQTLYPRERPGINCTGGWVGNKAGLDECRKCRPPPPGFDPRTVHPAWRRYTDCAIPTQTGVKTAVNFTQNTIQGRYLDIILRCVMPVVLVQ